MADSAIRKKIVPTAWPSGQSGNPVGRPKINPDLRVMTRELCVEVIETWTEIMRDSTAKKADRIKAGENIWAVAYGRPGPQEPEAAKERPIVIPAEFVE
jgi:hypothetical protein